MKHAADPALDDDRIRDILEESRGYAEQTFTAPGIAEATIEQGESLHRHYDPRRRAWIRFRRRRAKGLHLNLLDHEGKVLNRDDLMMIGISAAVSLQGILLAGILGMIMAALGMFSGVSTILRKFLPHVEPIVDNMENILKIAEQQGLPVEMLERKLAREMVGHFGPTRIFKYAMMTMFGRGAGSFWLSSACMVTAFATFPDVLHSATASFAGISLMKHAFEDVADDILSYRFLHHPEVVAERIYEATREYNRRLEKPLLKPEQSFALEALIDFLNQNQPHQQQERETHLEKSLQEERHFNTQILHTVLDVLEQHVTGASPALRQAQKEITVPEPLQQAFAEFAHAATRHTARSPH